ncbi:MDR family MFS transporter [Fructobacillus tropaeoli]|uniref:MFS family (AraJ) n=1 Tax=Fructobacillus tropaeoli TaxID=709323 RepID=A0A3F3HCB3_9LACO|nr:MDR family MFS transporter [Fructobacillus tropaeoli]CAK1228231.1 MFS family (AraJ) [Fructobacillus tropaeoli]CAK1244336.1 MFS family (AraJ) [Fructobacillus tropaeoli]CAK1246052.1 MFS family (AraJ) [Fructobacillus tropaeoli]CAK1252906.1 MFS family (AraJ) [Fructobacillus tropaeoli]GAP04680.1 multidrug transport protein [Fructobacillus tropaeoli]
MAENTDMNGKPINRAAMMALLMIGSFIIIIMQTSLGTALPTLMTAFNVDTATVQWLTTIFLMVNGIMVPVSAFLTTRIPTKYLYLSALVVYTIGTAVAYVTPTNAFWLLMVARALQAIAAGIVMPLMQVVALTLFDAKSRGKALGMVGLVIGMAPAIGPTLTGWILDSKHDVLGMTVGGDWRSIFGMVLPLAVIVLVLSIVYFRNVLETRKVSLDIRSLIESTVGFGLVLFGSAMVSNYSWTNFTWVLAPMIVGVLVIAEFVRHQLHMEKPFLDVSVFKNKQFALTSALVALTFIAMIGVEMVLPIYMQQVRGLSALNSGLTLLPGALMIGVMSPIAGYFYDLYGAKRLAAFGFAMILLGTIPFQFLTETTPTIYITALYMVRMMGVGITMMPLTSSAMGALHLNQTAQGTAVNNTARQIAASLGTAILASVMQSQINNNLPSDSLKTADPIAYGSKALQASLDGFHASFLLAACFALLAFALSFLMHKGKVEPKPAAGKEN